MADFIAPQDASLAAKKAQDSELVALKQQMDRLKGDLAPAPGAKQKLRKACTDFEAVFISKLWEQMRATIPKGGMLKSPQEDMYRAMFDREFTEKMAQDGGIGLGDMLYNQLKDKIKGGGKTSGKSGAQTLLAAPDSAAPIQPAPTGGLPDKPEFKVPRRNGVTASQTSSVPAPSTVPHVAAATPKPPASVPGAVMADVEALAQRIEAAYDRRQAETAGQAAQATVPSQDQNQGQAARYGRSSGSSSLTTGRRFATIG